MASRLKAPMMPPVTELSSPMMAFCTVLERESRTTRSKGFNCASSRFAEEAQKQNEHKVHDDRTQKLLEDRKGKMEHVVCYRCEDHGARIACGLWLCHSHSDLHLYEYRITAPARVCLQGRRRRKVYDRIRIRLADVVPV